MDDFTEENAMNTNPASGFNPERFPSTPNGNGGKLTLDQMWWYANMVSQSNFVPKHLQNRPFDIFTIFQYCAELNISPLAGLNGIAVINGQPRIYGDLLVALIIQHPEFMDFWFEFESGDRGLECRCTILRKGRKPFVGTFSEQDARDANLLGKMVWKQYFKQMLMRRALNLAFHYVFPDSVYGGLQIVDSPYSHDIGEEIEETAPIRVAQPKKPSSGSIALRDSATISDFIVATACPARRDILEIYSNLFKTQGEEFHEALVMVCVVLIEYVNSSVVSDGIIGLLRKRNPTRKDMAPITNEELSSFDDNFLIETINRLIDKYVVARIKLVGRLKALCHERGVYEAAILNQSQLLSEHLGTDSWGRGVEVSSADPVVSSLPYLIGQGDYTFIPFELLDAMVEVFVENRYMVDCLASSESDLLSTIFAQVKAPTWQVLSPFVKYPDVRAVGKAQFSDVVKFARYHAYLVDAEFLSDDEVVEFAVFLGCSIANDELDEYSKAISYNVAGIPSIDPTKIPLRCYQQYSEYQTFIVKKKGVEK